MAWPVAASAEDATITVDPEDDPLTISGFIGDAAGFQGTMRLTATGDVGTFRTLFSDLRTKGDPARIIDRSHLGLLGTSSMANDDVIDVQVRVDGVADPGTYAGSVELIPSGQKRAAATKVKIKLDATARPVLAPVTKRDKVSGSLTACGRLGCGVTGFLIPGDAGKKDRAVEFTLGKSQTAKVTAIKVFAEGEKNEHQLTNAELGLKPPYDSADGVVSIPTTIDPATVEADHYTGAMSLTVDNVDAPVTVPVDFSVRREPLFAIIVLVIGILLGLATKLFRGDGTTLLGLYRRASALERRVNASGAANKAELLADITQARAAIAANDAADAKKVLDHVESQLGEAPAGQAAAGKGAGAGTAHGAPFFRRESFLRFASLAFGFAAVVVLAFTGFQTQYVDKGTVFGSADIWDYIALLTWGFAAGLAGRALGSLGGSGSAPQ